MLLIIIYTVQKNRVRNEKCKKVKKKYIFTGLYSCDMIKALPNEFADVQFT